jgi:hypothetical protein
MTCFHMARLIFVFIPLLLGPLRSAADAARTKVVCLGDSVTLGEGGQEGGELRLAPRRGQFTVGDAEPRTFRLVHFHVPGQKTAGRRRDSGGCRYDPGPAWDQ